jgi:hypothetical protein
MRARILLRRRTLWFKFVWDVSSWPAARGEGTVAQLCLPVAPVRAQLATKENTPPPEVSAGKLVILSVDDDPLVALNTTALLEELGHEVHADSSGATALKVSASELSIC